MLQREEVLRLIDADRLEPIQEEVKVEFDNGLQSPLSFNHRGRHHEVLRVIGVFPVNTGDPSLLYLVQTGWGIYALHLKLRAEGGEGRLQRGQWVLHFRVEEGDVERDHMLVEMQLKMAADFHGHLCPDLVIGYRACRHALAGLGAELSWSPRSWVVAENSTSALDAVQKLTRCTLGNGRLLVRDLGKHCYTFANGEGRGLRLILRSQSLNPDGELASLELRVAAGEATLDETARYQALLNSRVSALLQVPASALFDCRRVVVTRPSEPATSVLTPCDLCGEPVIVSHLTEVGGRRLCRPCASVGRSGG